MPANCTSGGVHDRQVLIILPIASATSASGNGEPESPAAHAVRLAERVRGDALLQHAGLSQQRMMPPLPDHVTVRLVAEDGDVLPPQQIGNVAQVLLGRHAAGRVVRRVEKDRLRRRGIVQKRSICSTSRPELVLERQRSQHDLRPAPFDVRHIRREVRAEHQHRVSRIEKRLAEELLEHLRPRPGDDVLRLGRDAELPLHEVGCRLAKLRQSRARDSSASDSPRWRRCRPLSPRPCSRTDCRRSPVRRRLCPPLSTAWRRPAR